MQILNIIGCGRVGRTLARLWHEGGVFTIGDISDRTADKSRAAVAFIGGGRASADLVDRFALHDKTGVETGLVPH